MVLKTMAVDAFFEFSVQVSDENLAVPAIHDLTVTDL